MTSLTFLRRTLPFLAAFLMASCGDPTVSYWKKAADINTEYSEKSDALVQRLLKLKKNPTLPGLAESSRDAADLLRERDEELADLSTKDVDPPWRPMWKKTASSLPEGGNWRNATSNTLKNTSREVRNSRRTRPGPFPT